LETSALHVDELRIPGDMCRMWLKPWKSLRRLPIITLEVLLQIDRRCLRGLILIDVHYSTAPQSCGHGRTSRRVLALKLSSLEGRSSLPRLPQQRLPEAWHAASACRCVSYEGCLMRRITSLIVRPMRWQWGCYAVPAQWLISV